MVSENKIFKVSFHYKSMGANDPRGMANLDPRGMDGRIYVEDHQMCYTLNLSALGLMLSKKIFEGSLAIQFYIKI